MPRCEQDSVLFRVFCVTLVAVAITFTVIITNVFVDIDSLLTSRGKERETPQPKGLSMPKKPEQTQTQEQDPDIWYNQDDTNEGPQEKTESPYESDIEDDDMGFRTKRSLEEKKKFQISKELQMTEKKFFDELTKCKKLQKKIRDATEELDSKTFGRHLDEGDTTESRAMKSSRSFGNKWNIRADRKKNTPLMLINTIIDIKTKPNKNYTNSQEHIKGLIKLIYNGKQIKVHDLEKGNLNKQDTSTYKSNKYLNPNSDIVKENKQEDENSYNFVEKFLDKVLYSYFKKHQGLENKLYNKRLKRSIRIKIKDTTTAKPKTSNKTDDTEVLVEIETHFDSEGVKGEQKKKLIRTLVSKIQEAIHSNIDTVKVKKKKGDVKKRTQDLRKNKEVVRNKIISTDVPIAQRQLNPIISKTVHKQEGVPKVFLKGVDWKNPYSGPHFLSKSKAINSGEEGKVDLIYSNIMNDNGIPQRLQKPLNSDNVQEVITDEGNYFNIGDLKFYIKEIDGTGFAIGFNQYVGEAPDPESVNLFTGLQQLIKTYHQNYDEDNATSEEINVAKSTETDFLHEIKKRDIRPGYTDLFDQIPQIRDADHNRSNEYKVIFGDQYLPYDSYSEIYEDQNKKVQLAIKKDNYNFEDSYVKADETEQASAPIVINDNLFEKALIPSEIFGIASILERKKRSPTIQVKMFSNLSMRKRSRHNKFLNTNKKVKRVLVQSKNKRNKREIDKIRIIATDNVPNFRRHLDENVFVLSDESLSNRNNVQEPEVDNEESKPQEDIYIHPQHVLDPNSHPLFSEFAYPRHYSVFTSRSRHNALMSKYPHLFMDAISEEEESPPLFYSKLINGYSEFSKNFDTTTSLNDSNAVPLPFPMIRHNSIKNILVETPERVPRSNYKVTVKIVPKNDSELLNTEGFNEIHTSINKSIHRNGLVYSSQLNVSELSKVEKAPSNESDIISDAAISDIKGNDTKNATTSFYPLVKHIREQQEKMKQLLKQHRQKIEIELNTLKKEKQNIESMIPNENKTDIIDVMLPLNPPQLLHLNRDEAGRLIKSTLMKLHYAPQLNDINSATQKPEVILNSRMFEVKTSTTKISPSTTPQPTITEPEKARILSSIQRNENLTKSILYKIDKNTNMLQHFLQKLTALSKPQKPHLPEPFEHVTPNLDLHKDNDTAMTIPFVYGYQQPYPLPAESNSPVANVVYHGHQGHKHTNVATKPITTDEKEKAQTTEKRELNRRMFFFDGTR